MRILNQGTRLADRYNLIRRLGGGGMAEIWLADDQHADARIALKFLAGDAAGDPRQKDLLQREWRIGSRLMHPNIIRVFEFHDDPDGAYFGLQYVGESDVGVLAGVAPRDSMRPVGLVADALRYAHGKGIVHRDIKASNILLDSRGIPYLVDFGVAAQAGSADQSGSGSAVAMSPQQRAGEAASSADDIFALGVLVHELLTGRPPGNGELPVIESKLADGSPIPGALLSLMSDMLAADAAARPDAESVAERLASAGFPPGAAPQRYVSAGGGIDEIVESVQPLRSFAKTSGQTAAASAVRADASGIPPRLLYGGLGAALLVFLVVIFVLPDMVDRDVPATTAQPDAAPETDAGAAAPQASDADTEAAEPGAVAAGSDASFSENTGSAGDTKSATDEALGDLLSQLERLRYRAIERWGGQPYLDAVDIYAEGDQAYVDRNYRLAGEKYREASRRLAPFFGQIDGVFEETLAAARAAFDAADPPEAVRLYDLAAAITPGNREAEAGLERATKLASVLSLMEQGQRYEAELEFNAARLAFEKALDLDPRWQAASAALQRVDVAIRNLSFQQRMTEGLDALMAGDFDSARAAFNAAKLLNPDSREPVDGLLQVDQEVRLADIRRLENEAAAHDQAEEWETSIGVYQAILKIDPDLQFAKEGLANARSRAGVHAKLQSYIDDPDNLSDDANMQNATRLLLEVARIEPMGPRLEDQKDELSRLLKRAATPLRVQLVSDGQTEVSVYKIGRFGSFMSQELELRPGNYVAVGIRPGYRDVRVEFRVAPEVEMQPVVVVCRESI